MFKVSPPKPKIILPANINFQLNTPHPYINIICPTMRLTCRIIKTILTPYTAITIPKINGSTILGKEYREYSKLKSNSK
jgi:hypothetical protein